MREAVDGSGVGAVGLKGLLLLTVPDFEARRAMHSSRLAPWQAAGGPAGSAGQSFGIVLES